MRTPLTLALVLAVAVVAAGSAPEPDDLRGAAAATLETLKGAAEDRLMVTDLIGHQVRDPSGEVVGTVQNLVAIPGGRLVAVVLALKEGGRIPVPYQLMTIAPAGQALDISLPSSVDALRDDPSVTEMGSLLDL